MVDNLCEYIIECPNCKEKFKDCDSLEIESSEIKKSKEKISKCL